MARDAGRALRALAASRRESMAAMERERVCVCVLVVVVRAGGSQLTSRELGRAKGEEELHAERAEEEEVKGEAAVAVMFGGPSGSLSASCTFTARGGLCGLV